MNRRIQVLNTYINNALTKRYKLSKEPTFSADEQKKIDKIKYIKNSIQFPSKEYAERFKQERNKR